MTCGGEFFFFITNGIVINGQCLVSNYNCGVLFVPCSFFRSKKNKVQKEKEIKQKEVIIRPEV